MLFVGSGFSRKGLTYLFDAFGSLKTQGQSLWVVGKGHLPLSAAGPAAGAGGRLRFWGPETDLAPFYQAATVLALPTIYDPCSNVVLEALGCGAPVVTTAANGAAEFITPGENGAESRNRTTSPASTAGPDHVPQPGTETRRCAGPRPRRWPT